MSKDINDIRKLKTEINKVIEDNLDDIEEYLNRNIKFLNTKFDSTTLNPFKVAELFQIKLRSFDSNNETVKDISAFFKVENDSSQTIYCSNNLNENDLKFLIMYEIGYKLLVFYALNNLGDKYNDLAKGCVLNFISNVSNILSSDDDITTLCKNFVINSLIPLNNKMPEGNTTYLARYFKVGEDVIEYKLKMQNDIFKKTLSYNK